METKLDRIELNLENCQVAPISADYIISCNIGHCYSTYEPLPYKYGSFSECACHKQATFQE